LIVTPQKALDDSNIVGTVLIIDLSKAYDSLPHDLLIAKLAAYVVSHNSLLFIFANTELELMTSLVSFYL